MVESVRPEAVVSLIALAIIVLIGVIIRLSRGPLGERDPSHTPPGPYVLGAVLVVLTLVAASVGRAAIFGGRVLTKAWHGGAGKPA